MTTTRFATNKPIYYFLASPIQHEQRSFTHYIKTLFRFIQTVNIFNGTNCWYRRSRILASFLCQLIKQEWKPNKELFAQSIYKKQHVHFMSHQFLHREEYFWWLFLVKFTVVLWIETLFSILLYPIFCLKLNPSFYTIKVVNPILQ